MDKILLGVNVQNILLGVGIIGESVIALFCFELFGDDPKEMFAWGFGIILLRVEILDIVAIGLATLLICLRW